MRLKLLRNITFLLFLLLFIGLTYIQLIKGAYYFRLSQNNRIKLISLPAARGKIYDRKGRVLATQRLMFNVAVLTQETRDVARLLSRISPVLGISTDKLLSEFKKNFSAPFAPVVVARDIPKEVALVLECREEEIPGLMIQAEPVRDYPYGVSLGHLIGYLGWVSEEELSRFRSYGLRVKDLIGRGGIEGKYDLKLRGHPGGMQVEVDNRGHRVRVLGKRTPRSGEDIYLTIDAQLQRFVDSLLEEEVGACIVMNPQDGSILALVSKPGFDPNLFIAAVNRKSEAMPKIKRLLNSEQASLINRAISGIYSPGSIFKIVVASAGLESNKISLESSFNCSGSLRIGEREFLCWNLDGHGEEDIYWALVHSCNIFFYKLGLTLGPELLSTFARRFGLGQPSGIDLLYEAKGFVPSPTWKLKVHRERWYEGETANFSIGQGFLSCTPLQVARMVAVVANGGYLVRPRIVKQIGQKHFPPYREKLALKKETLAIIKQGMQGVIQESQGTGHNAYIPDVAWAAKTGTAQTAKELPHGWFAGFYPIAEPRVLVLVFLEYGGSGGEAPARIAKEILEYIIEHRI